MENKKRKNLIAVIIVVIVIFIVAFLGYNQVKKVQEEKRIQEEQQAVLEQQKAEEEQKKEEIKQKEKQYAENSKYQCFNDNTFKIRFYYNTENTKYGSLIAQTGKLAKQKKNGNSMFSYSTEEMYGEYDSNQFIANFMSQQTNAGFIINENKDITISKIKPTTARYIEAKTGNVTVKNYFIFNQTGICKFSIAGSSGTESQALNEILDTIVTE